MTDNKGSPGNSQLFVKHVPGFITVMIMHIMAITITI